MTASRWRHLPPTIPALAVLVIGYELWIWAIAAYIPSVGGGAAVRVNTFVGWVGVLFLLDTLAAIGWAGWMHAGTNGAEIAAERGRTARLGFIRLACGSCAMLATVGLTEGFIGWMGTLRLCLLLVAWMGLWSSVAWLLCRWSAGVGLSLTAAMLLLSGPISLVPLARAAGAASPWQGRIAQGIALGCPLLGSLDAMRPAIRIDWAQLPLMYRMSGLGQDIPLSLPPWWLNALVYAIPVAAIGLLYLVLPRFRKSKSAGTTTT